MAPFVFLQTFSLFGFISSSDVNNPPNMFVFSSAFTGSAYSLTKGFRKTNVFPPLPNWQSSMPRHPASSLVTEMLNSFLSKTHLAAQALYSALSNLYCHISLLILFLISFIYPYISLKKLKWRPPFAPCLSKANTLIFLVPFLARLSERIVYIYPCIYHFWLFFLLCGSIFPFFFYLKEFL